MTVLSGVRRLDSSYVDDGTKKFIALIVVLQLLRDLGHDYAEHEVRGAIQVGMLFGSRSFSIQSWLNFDN